MKRPDLFKTSFLILTLLCPLLLSACGISLTGAPPFEDLNIEDGYTQLSMEDGRNWEVKFELPVNSTFSGTVRHTSRWSDNSLPFMSHDILVTTEEFADPEIVDAWVANHMFFYHYKSSFPKGKINLLHIFPATLEVFEQLKEIKKWDQVSITGREILRIDIYDAEGEHKGYFTDMGCNSILVTAVEILGED